MEITPTVGRPADRRQEIVRELRRQIVGGAMPPGSQLPTRLEIESRFGVSPLTVQRALENLRDDGFITVNGRQGTFVSTNPPHLTNFALVFPHRPQVGPWVRFWTALSNQAASLPLARERKLQTFHCGNGVSSDLAFQELSQQVRAHRVAGLIFATSPHLLKNTPVLDEPGIPRVAIQSVGEGRNFPVVDLDRRDFLMRALKYLRERGRKRVACIGPPNALELQDEMHSMAGEYDLATRPYWWQAVSASSPEAARNCAHLLMHSNQSERPDALIISDDNLVEHAMGGLIAAGMDVPRDLEIVAHCNFPWHAPSVLPCRRLGFDSRQVLNTCIEIIDAQRRGEVPAAVTQISAVFEDELVADG